MRVVTLVSVGFAAAVLPLVAVLAYVVSQVDRLAMANRQLATTQYSAVTESTRLIRQLDLLKQYTEKYAVSDDRRYIARVRDSEDRIDGVLIRLQDPGLSRGQREEAARFDDAWKRFRPAFERALSSTVADAAVTTLQVHLPDMSALQDQALAIEAATRSALTRESEAAAAVRSTAERMSWATALGAAALSAVIFLLTFRAIQGPLSRLVAGTRAVARGDFSFRIENTGGGEFADLSKAFNSMVGSIYKLLRMKSDFVSHVSHELKTPLVSMHETNQLLLDGLPGPLTHKQRRLLELNVRATRRLSSMITDLLELTAAERGMQYDRRANDLCEIVRASAEEVEARALDVNIEIRLRLPSHPVRIACDRDRIIQVIQNLIDNALKHTPAGGTVEVRVGEAVDSVVPSGMREQIGDFRSFVLLEVDDSGPGLSPGEQQKIFERFYQGEGAKPGGVGLGLAICREIVDAHGGVVSTRVGQLGGACFVVLLPRTEAVRDRLGRG